jgi:hypothetical protein
MKKLLESKFGTFIAKFVVSHNIALNCGRRKKKTGLGNCDIVAYDTLNIKNRA